jgi:hypothetical protein
MFLSAAVPNHLELFFSQNSVQLEFTAVIFLKKQSPINTTCLPTYTVRGTQQLIEVKVWTDICIMLIVLFPLATLLHFFHAYTAAIIQRAAVMTTSAAGPAAAAWPLVVLLARLG